MDDARALGGEEDEDGEEEAEQRERGDDGEEFGVVEGGGCEAEEDEAG